MDSETLKASGLTNGAKVMLVASQGLHQGVNLINPKHLYSINFSFLFCA